MEARKSAVPFYVVGVIWLAWSLVLPLYAVWHYVAAAVLSGLAFVAADRLCRGAPVSVQPTGGTATAQSSGTSVETGNTELDQMLRTGQQSIAEMRRLNDRIADPDISNDISRLERASAQIFEQVRQHPEKMSQIRRFMDYYLPTTLKLLNAYDRASSTGVSGTNINDTMRKVKESVHMVADAFEKQLDALFGDEALDISAEISVMESMLAQEGLSGGADDDFQLDL